MKATGNAAWNRCCFGVGMAVAAGLLALHQGAAAQFSREAEGVRLLKGAVPTSTFTWDPWVPGARTGQASIEDGAGGPRPRFACTGDQGPQ